MRRWLFVAVFCVLRISFAQTISNTATVTYVDSFSQAQSISSNTVNTVVLPNPTPAVITFLTFSPPVGSESLRADGTLYWNGSSYQAVPAPATPSGGALDLSNPIPLNLARALRADDPLIVKLEDLNRNVDPLVREWVIVELTTTQGDLERLQLQEEGPNTGVYVGAINTERIPPLVVNTVQFDGVLQVGVGDSINVEYEDADHPSDSTQVQLLIDPYGVVFNSSTGAPINGVLVSLVHAASGLPATVYDDDGTTSYPSEVISGCQTVGPQCPYVVPDGSFRFPIVPAGDYRIVISQLPANSAWPTSVALPALQALTNSATGLPFSLNDGYDGQSFTLQSGPPVNVDVPVDFAGVTDLLITKTASKSDVSHGDFVRYEVLFRNISASPADDVVLTDTMPAGFRYKPGSLRIEGVKAADPTVSSDGKTLQIALGDVPNSSDRRISYVTEIGAGAVVGRAVNTVVASRSNGPASNPAYASVMVRNAFFASHAVVVGRILETQKCDIDITDTKAVKGVPKVRVLMEDGTYVATDEEGRFHFEKVSPGTHVLQVDESSLPKNLELVACDKNTRFAGKANSQFIDVGGGALWRTNFYLRQKEIPKGSLEAEFLGEVGLLSTKNAAEVLYSLKLKATRDMENLKVGVQLPEGFEYLPLTGVWKSSLSEAQLEGGKAVFRIPNMAKGESGVLTFRAIPQSDLLLIPEHCLKKEYQSAVDVRFEVKGFEGQAFVYTETPTCAESEVKVHEGRIAAQAQQSTDEFKVLDDATASGANRNWIQGQAPGAALLFPEENYNPRAPSTRIVIKHGANDEIDLRINGEPVSNILFVKTHSSLDKSVNATEWKGVPLKEGANLIEAAIKSASGATLQILKRTIHFANVPERVIFVPERSKLKANGVDKARIAVRFLDKQGKPVRKGVRGSFKIEAPYVSAQFEEYAKRRQLSALDRFEPEYHIATDDGLAFIELAPTHEAGEVKLKFYFDEKREIEVNTWLEPAVEDWVVVGFVEGTAGYETLKGNMVGLAGGDTNQELNVDDQVKLYAKGKISSQWIATVAYDSEKTKDQKEDNFKGIIDPNQFYTLYGDNTTQRNDAPSSDKLYLKLERSRFYALFGDYDSGLNETELARYNRSFTGVKSEYSGKFLGFKIFGTERDSYFYKDEMQAQSQFSGYRLSRGNILVNSEKIRLVIRDRFRSDRIIKEEFLSRHIDYSIDYRAGTIIFKRVVDAFVNMNPQFIVVEYETLGVATKDYTYGGRLEGKVFDDKVKVGVTHVEEDEGMTSSTLQGADATIKLAQQTELELEAAQTKAEPNGTELKSEAYRAELDHRSQDLDANLYVKEMGENYGLGQQAASENGSFKAGGKASIHITKQFDVNTEYNHQRQIASGNTQDVAKGGIEYKHANGSVALGGQKISEDRGSTEIEADQATASITQRVFNSRLELQATAEQNLGSEQSVDYPNRYILQAGFKLTDKVKLIAAQEYADGEQYDSSTTRVGFESTPWNGAKLGSTVNQSVTEYGPRTYSTMGFAQSLPFGKYWTFDGSLDATTTFKERGPAVPINPSHPLTSGGFLGNGGYTEDYVAATGGMTFRQEPWTWNFRIEGREGEIEDRMGVATNLIRELSKGIVLGTSHQYFRSVFAGGANGQLFQGDFSLAYRPLDSRWTILDRVKYRYEMVDNAQSLPIFGQTTLQGVDDAVSAAIVNNLNINRLSKSRKNQFSVYYGTKLVVDTYDGDRYQSITDLYGLEIRQDITEKWDIGFQGSLLNSWTTDTMKYSYGPSVGWTPVTNSWMSVGYNFRGFYDRDFDAARYTGQGIYLKLRLKFDEKTLGLKKEKKEEVSR